MGNIVGVLKSTPDYIGSTGRTDDEIRNAEKLVGVEFASDYRCYLKEIGLACFGGHELTGICKPARLNVVDATIALRALYAEAHAWYVIEETNIDGIVIWQTSTGDIYKTAPGIKARKVFNSLSEYVEELCR